MEIESAFSVPAPPQEVYRFLLELESVAPCMPGGTLGAPDPDGVYPASVTVRLGPMRLTYDGTMAVADANSDTLTATLAARARERRGTGTVRSTITMQVAPDGEGSAVTVTTRLELTGRAAQMGRGIVEDVARKLVGEMAACLAARIPLASPSSDHATSRAVEAPLSPQPLSALPLLGQRLRRALAAILGRGARDR